MEEACTGKPRRQRLFTEAFRTVRIVTVSETHTPPPPPSQSQPPLLPPPQKKKRKKEMNIFIVDAKTKSEQKASSLSARANVA